MSVKKALNYAYCYSQIDGVHHKQWVIDRMVRALLETDEAYEKFVKKYCDGVEGTNTYEWDTGINP